MHLKEEKRKGGQTMRLSNALNRQIIEQKCSRTDIKIILFLLSVQQEDGCCYNVHSTSLCEELHINQPTYCRRIKSLEHKGILSIREAGKGFNHITVNYSKDYQEGHYINIHREIFGEDFFSLKATEMYAVLRLMERNRDNFNELKCSEQTLADYAGISPQNKRVIKRIVRNIASFFTKGKKVFDVRSYKSGYRMIHVFQLLLNGRRVDTYESTVQQTHKFKSFLKRHKVNYSPKQFEDLLYIGNSFREHIGLVNQVVKEITLQYGEVNCAVIHHKIKQLLANSMKANQGEFVPLV